MSVFPFLFQALDPLPYLDQVYGYAHSSLASMHWADMHLADVHLADIATQMAERVNVPSLSFPSFPTIVHSLSNSIHSILAPLKHLGSSLVHRFDNVWLMGRESLHQVGQWIESLTGTIAGFVASTALWQVGLYWVLLLLMVAGVVGSFVPALPGMTLVLLAVIIWGLSVGFSGIVLSLVVAIAAVLLCLAIDNLAGLLSAQKVGASRWGQVGAVIGMICGFFGLLPALPVGGPLLGIIFGTVLGAFIGEFLHRHDLELLPRTKQSAKVGIAIVVGNLVGNLLQGVIALITLIIFVFDTWGTMYG